MNTRRHFAITLQQAANASPTLAKLVSQARDSGDRLKSIQPLLPPGLRASVQAGPIEGDTWCLVVRNTAAATKVRYLLPAFAAHLRTKGWDVQHIRVKVLGNSPWQSPS